MSFIIYVATNTENGKRYIGMTGDTLRRRIASHFSVSGKNPKTALHRAIKKYGRSSFVFEHVASCRSREAAQTTEIAMIKQERTRAPHGYNMTPGGDYYEVTHSPDVREKIAASKRAYWASMPPEQRAGFGEKISQSRLGVRQPNSKGGTPLKGLKRPPEFGKKVSDGLRQHFTSRRDNMVDKTATLL